MKRKHSLIALLCLLCIASSAFAAPGDSWSHINQRIQRPSDWKQIVKNSAFQIDLPSEETDEVDRTDEIRELSFGSYPSLDGSTVSVPMGMEYARQHLGLDDTDLDSFVFFTTTHSAYEHLILKQPNLGTQLPSKRAIMDQARPVDLILVTEPSDDELLLAKENGVELVIEPVCLDAFVFITHKDNPVDNLTTEQIQSIYAGEIINWQELGGEDVRIAPFQREPNSGSQTAMEKLVMQDKPLVATEKEYAIVGMGQLVEAIADYKTSLGSIGYTYQYYIDTLYKNENIKVLSVDGIAPTPDNLQSGAYPYTTAYYGVHRAGEETETAGLFLAWILSDEGQRCMQQAGYIPVRTLP